MPKASSIDEYLGDKPAPVQRALAEVRRSIARAIPAALEGISYQIPAFKLGTSPVVFFAGWTEHYSLYPASAGLVKAFAKELSPYSVSKGTIRFPLSAKVPTGLIGRLAKFLFQEALEREVARSAKKAARRSARASPKSVQPAKKPARKAAVAKAPAARVRAAKAPAGKRASGRQSVRARAR